MVTELCLGGELYDYLCKNDNCTERIASLIIQQILSGVTYCHSKNIVHRDLRLENIMIEDKFKHGESPSIKISDFGASATYRPLRNNKKQPRGH
jgi:serine/threonine protein kinase